MLTAAIAVISPNTALNDSLVWKISVGSPLIAFLQTLFISIYRHRYAFGKNIKIFMLLLQLRMPLSPLLQSNLGLDLRYRKTISANSRQL